MSSKIVALTLVLAMVTKLTEAGIVGMAAYGICQSGCNAVTVACYAAAGFIFGTVTMGLGTPAAVVACSVSQGLCMAGCVMAGAGPV